MVAVVAGCAGTAAERREPAEGRALQVEPHPAAASPVSEQGSATHPVPVAVAPCTAVRDMGRYALPTWALLGRPSAADPWPAGPPPEALEEQLAAADPASPDRPRLLLEIAWSRLRVADESPIPDWRTRARMDAIRVLATRIQDHPTAPETDTTLYLLGWALQQTSDPERARQVYFRLVRAYPSSRWVPFAYLAFADHYFHAGDLEAASRFYEKVLELANRENHLAAFVLYRLAAAMAQLEQQGDALARHAQLERVLGEDPAIPDGAALRAAAERDACGLSSR